MKANIKYGLLIGFCTLILACEDKKQKLVVSMQMPNRVHTIEGITINDAKTAQNLSLFILTGKEGIVGKSYTTLSEAMDKRQVEVQETGSVNQLSIDNNGSDYVFIHSGDIVKGGKQDRTISYDVVISPNTKNIQLESFCVEQGRWQQRDGEVVESFSVNSKMLSSRDLKLAAKHENDQDKVWSKVSEQKEYLSDNLTAKNGYSVNVSDTISNTSLQLALESVELEKAKGVFYEKLKDLITIPDALGYAYTINGEIYGVEVYNNKQLFKDLWEKIIESVIVEAISMEGKKEIAQKTRKDVLDYMRAVSSEDIKTVRKLNKLTNFKTIENEEGFVVFTTEDLEKNKWVHKSYMQINTTVVK